MSSRQLIANILLITSLVNTASAHNTYSMKVEIGIDTNTNKETPSPTRPKLPAEKLQPDYIANFHGGNGITNSGISNFPEEIEKEAAAMLDYLARAKRTREEPDFPDGVTCDICEFFVGQVRSLVRVTQTLEELLAGVSEICAVTHIVSRDICRMIVHEYQAQIIYIFNHLVLSPEEVCGLVLGEGCATPYFPGHMWDVKLPDIPKPPPEPPVVPQPGAPQLRVLHLTDIHLDPQYEPGSKATCKDPLCCRKESRSENFLDLLSRQRPLTSSVAGKYGSFSKCDCPIATATDLFKHLRSIQDQFDYVLFTGDIPPHDVWNQTHADQKSSIRHLDRLFREFLPNKPLFQAVGNHESAPCNSFPPPGIPNHNSSWLFDTLVDVWGRWLPRDELQTVASCGSYSHSPYPGFRIISLNNNYCNTLNFWLLLNATDPCDSLQWLIQELQAAEDKGEKVHLLLHIPPGSSNCMKAWSWNFYKIISRYENTIVNQFYGHDHRDFFHMFLDDVAFQRPVGVGFAAPSVTSYSATNPTFRIYTMDGNYSGSSWAVLDFTTYYLNITEANEKGELKWRPEYSVKKDLGLTGLYAADWSDLIHRMETDDALFQRVYKYYSVLNTHGPCSGHCKSDLVCRLKEGRSYDPKLCEGHQSH